MKIVTLFVLLVTGCAAEIDIYNYVKKLVIVAPADWRQEVGVYAEYKAAEGLDVQIINVESVTSYGTLDTYGENLRQALLRAHPDYVFLIGDISLIPTIYRCIDVSSWTDFSKLSCLYSDFWLSVGNDNQTSQFAVGRLLAKDRTEIINYYQKALNYTSIYGTPSGAYLINDRAYHDTEASINSYGQIIKDVGVNVSIGVLNSTTGYGPSAPEATYQTLYSAFNNTASFVMFLGHGGAQTWGYQWNLMYEKINFTNTKPVPLVLAVACETALSAPNVPWTDYYDSTGKLKSFSGPNSTPNSTITADMMGSISSLQFHQPADVIPDNMGRHFTSINTGGSMVYIGDTVITHESFNLTSMFFQNLQLAYKEKLRIGDVWFRTTKNLLGRAPEDDVNPTLYQFVGDPSTGFLQ